MNHYDLTVTCVHCGGRLTPRATGRSNGRGVRAVADCTTCRVEHLITVTLSTRSRGTGRSTTHGLAGGAA